MVDFPYTPLLNTHTADDYVRVCRAQRGREFVSVAYAARREFVLGRFHFTYIFVLFEIHIFFLYREPERYVCGVLFFYPGARADRGAQQ